MQLAPPGGRALPAPNAALTLGELRRLIPSNPHQKTVELWCTKGVQGHVLRHEWHGNRRFTCLAWYDEFSQAIKRSHE